MLLRYHFLRFRILTGTAFHKFICRHQFNCIDTKLFPVRDHFLQCLKSSLCTGYRPIRFCISAHMQFIKDHFVIWNSRIFVVLPVKNFFFKKSSPDFVRIRTHLCTKAFPSQNLVRTGISIHLSIYQKIVLVLFQIKIRNIHCIYISGSVFFCKRNLHIRFCWSLFVENQRCSAVFRYLNCKITAICQRICTRHKSQPLFCFHLSALSHLFLSFIFFLVAHYTFQKHYTTL